MNQRCNVDDGMPVITDKVRNDRSPLSFIITTRTITRNNRPGGRPRPDLCMVLDRTSSIRVTCSSSAGTAGRIDAQRSIRCWVWRPGYPTPRIGTSSSRPSEPPSRVRPAPPGLNSRSVDRQSAAPDPLSRARQTHRKHNMLIYRRQRDKPFEKCPLINSIPADFRVSGQIVGGNHLTAASAQ